MKARFAVWLTALALAGVAGCNKSEAPEPAATEAPDSKPGEAASAEPATPQAEGEAKPTGAQSYGAPLGDSPEVALTDLLTTPESYADKSVRTAGLVRQACTKKGCWMEVAAAADEGSATTRVTFKDYGFFVPLDSAGSQARLEGQVVIKTVAKEDVDHLEAEGAKFVAKADDGSAREVQFIASGVELVR